MISQAFVNDATKLANFVRMGGHVSPFVRRAIFFIEKQDCVPLVNQARFMTRLAKNALLALIIAWSAKMIRNVFGVKMALLSGKGSA